MVKETAYRALHAFGQMPTFERGDLVLVETGAIVFHIAASHVGLPPDTYRACSEGRVFAALNRWSRRSLNAKSTPGGQQDLI